MIISRISDWEPTSGLFPKRMYLLYANFIPFNYIPMVVFPSKILFLLWALKKLPYHSLLWLYWSSLYVLNISHWLITKKKNRFKIKESMPGHFQIGSLFPRVLSWIDKNIMRSKEWIEFLAHQTVLSLHFHLEIPRKNIQFPQVMQQILPRVLGIHGLLHSLL